MYDVVMLILGLKKKMLLIQPELSLYWSLIIIKSRTKLALGEHRSPTRPNAISHNVNERTIYFVGLLHESDPLQTVMGSCLAHGTSFHQILCTSAWLFLRNPGTET